MSDVLTRPEIVQPTRCENPFVRAEIKRSLPPLTSKVRLPQLDGVRGLAILLVLVWHYLVGPLESSSSSSLRFIGRLGIETWTGVDLFFVLSGFLIGGILIDAKGSDGYFVKFYIRRVFRILPVYFVLWASLPIWRRLVQAANGASITAMPWYVYATFTQNFWLANHSWDVWMSHTWSLAVEEQFYLALPLLIWAVSKQSLWKLALVITVGTFFFRSLLYLRFYPWGMAPYTLIFCRADALMLGVLGAILVRNPRWFSELQRRRKYLSTAAASGLLPLIIVTAKGWGMGTRPTSTLGFSLIATFYLFLVLAAVVSDGAFKRIFCMTWLRQLGTMAYGLYMFHGAVLFLTYACFGYDQPRLDKLFDVIPMLLAVAGSLALSHLSWKCFESKLVGLGHGIAFRLQEPLNTAFP